MVTIPGVILDSVGNERAVIDSTTSETITRQLTNVFEDDFVGAGHTAGIPVAGSPVAGYAWVKKIQGAAPPTVAVVANGANGIISLALAANSEKEEATLYQNDQLTWDVTKGLVYESRVAFAVLPSVVGVEFVFGMQSSWIDGPDNASYFLRFQANGSGAVNCQSYDGITNTNVASGVTLVAGVYHFFRIDAANPADIGFFIDGIRVNAIGSVGFAATGAAAILQLQSTAYKAAGTGVGTLNIDFIAVGCNRV